MTGENPEGSAQGYSEDHDEGTLEIQIDAPDKDTRICKYGERIFHVDKAQEPECLDDGQSNTKCGNHLGDGHSSDPDEDKPVKETTHQGGYEDHSGYGEEEGNSERI